jgi:hypothetical protein
MAKLPPPGYERHALDPNLVRKIGPPPNAAQAMYPYLRSTVEHRAREDEAERVALAKKKEGR